MAKKKTQSQIELSLLCVSNRPQFLDWLMYQYEKIPCDQKELVLLCNYDAEINDSSVRVIRADTTNLSKCRNQALKIANGRYMSWLDDDDGRIDGWWPVAKTILDGENSAFGSASVWLLNIIDMKCDFHNNEDYPVTTSMVVDSGLAKSVKFSENKATGTDVEWTREIVHLADLSLIRKPTSFIMSHNYNTSTKREGRTWSFDINYAIDRGVINADELELIKTINGN